LGILLAIAVPAYNDYKRKYCDSYGQCTSYVAPVSGRNGVIEEKCVNGFKVYLYSNTITQKLNADGKPETCNVGGN
ncbi:MAG: hypothetical protein ABIO44_03690, partial [Saprospiraceae bacterium]